MSDKKYDIPYAMKPSRKGKKKTRYATYIEDNDTFVNRILSSPGKKLLAYVTFFSIFAFFFLTALRNSQKPETMDYELDLDFSNSREENLIDDALINVNSKKRVAPEPGVVDEIDILDSDDGEYAAKKIPKEAILDKSKLKGTGSKADIEDELASVDKNIAKDAKKIKGEKVGSSHKKGVDDFDSELDNQVSSGNEKLRLKQLQWEKINASQNNKNNQKNQAVKDKPNVAAQAQAKMQKLKQMQDLENQVESDLDEFAAEKKGRRKNEIKGEIL